MHEPTSAIERRKSSLAEQRGSFSAFLAPLTQDSFRQVVSDVEDKLRVVNQTLSLLDNVLDSRGFEAILSEMLQSITLKTGELLNADRTTIFLLDEDKDELWSIVAEDDRDNTLELRFPKTVGIAGEVATQKSVINIPYDFYSDPRSKAAQEFDRKNHYRTYTMLALPLLSESGDLVAVVQLINKLKTVYDPNASLEDKIDLDGFSSHDEQVFEEFAPSIRLILESSRSFYKATQQQRAASALMKATKALSHSSLDLEETLARVMEEAKELMNADRSTLWLIDRDREELWTKLPIDGVLKEVRISMGAGFAGQVAMTGEPVLIPFDLYEHPNADTAKETDQKTHYRTCSMLCMPVFNANDELIAVTQLINKKKQGDFPPYNPANWPQAPECWRASFNRNDQEFMKAFNIQAGVALQNAKLFATVKQQEQMQHDILRSLSNAVLSTDKSGKILAANESAKNLLGFGESDRLEGRPITEVVQIKEGNFGERFRSALTGTDEKSRQQYYPDQTLLPAIGEELHSVHLSINSIADANDDRNVYGALVVMDDISQEKRFKNTLYRYMAQELAERLYSSGEVKLGGERREASVLFSDIRGYTTLTETMQAEEVVQLLNEYFETMVDAVAAHKGILDKYIGDAIMAVFGSSLLPLQDHAWMAVQTAIDMRSRLAHFNASRPENKKIRIGIGINSDSVISGNIGSSRRMEFTAIGDGVNVGSRLEGASKQYGCDIVISESTYKPCADRIRVRELDLIRVKGKNRPVNVYELVGLSSESISAEKQRAIDLYQEGRRYYLDRKFTKAMTSFGTILEEIDPHDKAALMHLNRCQHWLSHPPSESDWADGVWTLTEK
ncbi:GAF domain-containing protein [Microcoleus sp. FACHB-1515]|uniref:GAF domain-containing protein n=1 Tax=Cyanophyceae TaxID=3028117 RepID=UPI001683BF4A|nr:adenylate/guanylate cyclase domain-containing protein [Microcoleus sp. FACHB-1515]MBD2093027.1 GAF domain-containing protein [Microcoleus sp. FACHB-1515]